MLESEHEIKDIDDLMKLDERIFIGFIVLRALTMTTKKPKMRSELELIYSNYLLLMSERKNIIEMEQRLKAINTFCGVH